MDLKLLLEVWTDIVFQDSSKQMHYMLAGASPYVVALWSHRYLVVSDCNGRNSQREAMNGCLWSNPEYLLTLIISTGQ
jgi:hypothetical protein